MLSTSSYVFEDYCYVGLYTDATGAGEEDESGRGTNAEGSRTDGEDCGGTGGSQTGLSGIVLDLIVVKPERVRGGQHCIFD